MDTDKDGMARNTYEPDVVIFDIKAISDLARARGIVVVDNTFVTPYLSNLLLAWRMVVHSATKYLGGHSDVVGGFVATNHEATSPRTRSIYNAVGAVPARLTAT